MQQRKERLAALEADQAAEKLVAEVIDSVQVAVGEKHLFAVSLEAEGVVMDLHIQIIAEEIVEPKIVVAADQNDAAAMLTDRSEAVQNRKILLDDGEFPIEPEVEDIAIEDHQVIFADRLFEKGKGCGGVFPVEGIFGGIFEMDVGQHADLHFNPGKEDGR